MEKLTLYFHGAAVSEHALSTRPLAVGRAACCDVVISDLEVAPHQWLFVARGDQIVGYDLAPDGRRKAWDFPRSHELAIGMRYALRRQEHDTFADACGVREPGTEALVAKRENLRSRFFLHVGRGAEARRIALDDRPLSIGTARHNDVVLWDRAVSAEHCRIEPALGGMYLRDLNSRNGTHVQGVRISHCALRGGVGFRLGRTELFVVEETETRRARRPNVVAASGAMQRVLHDVHRWSQLSWPVLVLGESGVGKEAVAHLLHEQGPRAEMPYVALNAGGLPRELIESELFGHERGAFTGAATQHRGVFEQAHRGTLFLDEIGELPLDMQARLLRVLETGELRRVGAEASTTVDVRLVCATHRDLNAMVALGTFRRDLYYRIARLIVDVPPLRDRHEDIAALCEHFLRQIEGDVGKRTLTPDALQRVLSYAWPGNARELRNVLSTAAVATSCASIDCVDIELALRRIGSPDAACALSLSTLQRAVTDQGGNLAAAARVLGMARSTLRDRLRSGE